MVGKISSGVRANKCQIKVSNEHLKPFKRVFKCSKNNLRVRPKEKVESPCSALK